MAVRNRPLDQRLERKLLGSVAALGLASRLLFPSPAAGAGEFNVGGGAFISFTFGERLGVGYGLEAYSTYLLEGRRENFCGGQRVGIGPLVQFGMVNLEAPRLTLAVAGGGDLGTGEVATLSGEVGATYRFGERAGVGLHLGITPQFGPITTSARVQLGLDEYSIGVGARSSALVGEVFEGCIAIGRPLRSAHARVAIHAARGADRAWASDAQAECESVLAFAELAEQLVAADAPQSLVQRAVAAGEEEIGHALACHRLAGDEAAPPVVPPGHVSRAPLLGTPALVRLAVESWTDGVLGEGAAARWAGEAARWAPDGRRGPSRGQAVQARIAGEEASHARLGWDVLRWAIARGGDDVKHAVWHASNAYEPRLPEHDAAGDFDAREAGRAPAKRMASILDAHVANSHRRLAALMV